MTNTRPVLALLTALFAFAPGCALMSKGTALAPRYFSPETSTPVVASPSTQPISTQPAEPIALRLGLVEAASHLEERISYRVNASELGYYEERRWTERPDEYLRRALEQELFERRQLRRVVSGPGPTLDVELTAFEEIRGPKPSVRLALRFTVHDDRQASLERSLLIERPLAPSAETEQAALIASALGVALAAAVSEVGDAVVRELAVTAKPTERALTDGTKNPG